MSTTLVAAGQKLDWAVETFVAEPVAAVSSGHGWWDDAGGCAATIRAQDSITNADTLIAEPVAFSCKDHGADATEGVFPTLRAMGHGASHANAGGQVAVAIGFNACQDPDSWVERSGPLDTDGSTQAVAFSLRGREDGAQAEVEPGGVSPALRASEGGSTRPFVAAIWATESFDSGRNIEVSLTLRVGSNSGVEAPAINDGWRVRRLTPRECERLQGFPDDYTLIDTARGDAADGPRYKALGNSMAVPVMQWIGERIAMFENMRQREER